MLDLWVTEVEIITENKNNKKKKNNCHTQKVNRVSTQVLWNYKNMFLAFQKWKIFFMTFELSPLCKPREWSKGAGSLWCVLWRHSSLSPRWNQKPFKRVTACQVTFKKMRVFESNIFFGILTKHFVVCVILEFVNILWRSGALDVKITKFPGICLSNWP